MVPSPSQAPLFSRFPHLLVAATAGLLLFACGGKSEKGSKTESEGNSGAAKEEVPEMAFNLDIPMVTYAWNPEAGDPSVSAEMGGPGFTGEGWTTNMTFPAMGSPDAVKGGTIRMEERDWPVTLRLAGQNYNTSFNYRARDLCQESLLFTHPQTLELIPQLATHWKISKDKSTYTFRINPEARWSDGREVVSDDVIATYRLLMDTRILFPSSQEVFGKFEEPIAQSKYIVSVKVKTESWRNLLYFGTNALMPAHEISIPGDEYLKEYQNRHPALSGPYELKPEDIVTNQSLTLTRRTDWWAADNPGFQGLYNFDKYNFTIIRDPATAYEKAKKGDLDYYYVNRAKYWVEELVPEQVDGLKRGTIQKRKFFNDAPVGTQGIALNMSKPPLDDLRIRKALAFIQDRETLIKTIFFNEYAPMDSYWQYGDFRNPDNSAVPFDLFSAVELLEEAGWKEIDSDGYRVKDGKRLKLNLAYNNKQAEIYLTPYQENCKKAGIELEMQLLTPAAAWSNLTAREYQLASTAWGGLTFPNPETSWKGTLADSTNNNNVTGFRSEAVDKLLVEYDKEFDPANRSAIIRKIDGLVFEQHPYVLAWYGPAQRVLYQNKFKMPELGIWRYSTYSDLMYSWWIDPQMEADLEKANADPSITLETLPVEHKFWPAWNEKNQ